MYEYIKGKVTHRHTDYVVVETQGIGYRIYTSLGTIASISDKQEESLLYTHLHVREDVMVLYGFSSRQELGIFQMLIGISGIGPKAALSLLSTFSAQAVALNIATNNTTELSKAPGIGKKSAMRIVLELKDKFKNLEISSLDEQEPAVPCTNEQEEAKTALMVLGYTSRQAGNAIRNVYEEGDKVEGIIRKALNQMNGG
ncbi:MAG: Holliday junction branch migration protein RuvA [Clostridia bacterium]